MSFRFKVFPFKKIAFFLGLSAILVVSLGEVLDAQERRASYTTMTETEVLHRAVKVDVLRRGISFLTDSLCDGRATGTPGGVESAFWIMRRFEKASLLPSSGSYFRSFEASSGRIGHNIIGFMPAEGSSLISRGSYVLVMAYYDGIGTLEGKLYPGADSNCN